jgi:macrolide transport system ATP-binding/permease protein
MVLAAIGVYGVLSYSVSRRSREMGIRMALGAPAGAVRALIVRDGGRLAALGVGLGVVLAFGATRALNVLLFGVNPVDQRSLPRRPWRSRPSGSPQAGSRHARRQSSIRSTRSATD